MGGKGKGKGQGKGKAMGKGKAQAQAEAEPAEAKVPTSAADLPLGTEITAQFEDGAWYKAKIVKVRKNEPRVRVNYHGYEEYYDAWLGPDQLRSRLLKGPRATAKATAKAKPEAEAKAAPKATGTKLLEVGATCQVQLPESGKSCEGTVLSISTAKARTKAPVKVQVELWVPKSAVQVTRAANVELEPAPNAKAKGKAKAKAGEALASEAPATGLTVGTTLNALYDDGKYYQATVTKLKATGAKPIRIHYLGHDESSDRWVGLDSVRSKALPKATAKPKGKAWSGTNGSEGAKEAKVGRWKDEEDDPWEFVPPAAVKEGKGGGGKGRSKGKVKGKGR